MNLDGLPGEPGSARRAYPTPQRSVLRRCENCGSDASFTPAFAARFEMERCSACGGWSFVGQVELAAEKIYDEGYFSGGEYADYEASVPAQRRNFERKLRLLSRAGAVVGPDTRVLELGCATGAFLSLVRAAGAQQVLGVEVSEYARARAQGDGFTVLSPSAPELAVLLREFRPNLIVAWDVWEHLTAPATTLEAYLEAADPRAVVALTTVDASSGVARLRGTHWRQFHPPTHLHYPTRASLRQFLTGRSLRVVTHRSFGYYRPALEYLRVLGLEPALRRLGELRSMPVYLNLWDTQLVIARRQA